MDLGIKERSAIVCASSRGLGEACATSLAREGVRVFINGRNQGTLDEAALRIERTTGQRAFTVKADIVTINNLLPERIDTDRQRFMAERMMDEQDITFEEARCQIAESLSAKRFGLPSEFADACAFLCSVQASFISGQNLQIDGGSYRGLV